MDYCFFCTGSKNKDDKSVWCNYHLPQASICLKPDGSTFVQCSEDQSNPDWRDIEGITK